MSMDQTMLEAKRYGVIDCIQNKTLRHAAQRMVSEDVSSLGVVDEDGCLVGIISRIDLLRALVETPDWENQSVKDFMNPNVITVSPNTTLMEVTHLLLEKHIHRVVVVDNRDGKLRPISVVSCADIVYHMVKDL